MPRQLGVPPQPSAGKEGPTQAGSPTILPLQQPTPPQAHSLEQQKQAVPGSWLGSAGGPRGAPGRGRGGLQEAAVVTPAVCPRPFPVPNSATLYLSRSAASGARETPLEYSGPPPSKPRAGPTFSGRVTASSQEDSVPGPSSSQPLTPQPCPPRVPSALGAAGVQRFLQTRLRVHHLGGRKPRSTRAAAMGVPGPARL